MKMREQEGFVLKGPMPSCGSWLRRVLRRISDVPVQQLKTIKKNRYPEEMVRETTLAPQDFIYPMFVVSGKGVRILFHQCQVVSGKY